jgi:hypothetical protein
MEAEVTSKNQNVFMVSEERSYFDKRQPGEEKVAMLHQVLFLLR